MTIRGRLAILFPAAHLGIVLAGPVLAVRSGSGWWLGAALGILYLLPPLCYRLHEALCPVREGHHRLDEPRYSPWWTSLQLQAVFNALPGLEAVLRIVPGVYSLWLRLWGSRIGRGVVWTPRIEISDRGLLEVGDGAVFGHRVALYPHVVDRRPDGSMVLYLKRIRIGKRAFLGAGSRLGPGVAVADGARLPVLTELRVGKRFEREDS